jgi:hypothetical protein
MKISKKSVSNALIYIAYLIVIIIVFDVFILKHVLHYGYPTHFKEENEQRYPAPFVEFSGKPNTGEQNEFGFRGKSYRLADTGCIKIAFFGGSTGYYGNPTIPEILESELNIQSKQKVFVANFSVIGANHRQHLHAMIEHLTYFKPDIIVFYGGYNEIIQPVFCDPRPGYPYNFYYRRELSPFKKILLENSAILGEIDIRTGFLSGLKKLRKINNPNSNEWKQKIIENYFETLNLAKNASLIYKSNIFGNPVFYAFYQPFQVPKDYLNSHIEIKSRVHKYSFIYDVSDFYLPLKKDIYNDIVHVKQPANYLMGKKMAQIIDSSLFKKN